MGYSMSYEGTNAQLESRIWKRTLLFEMAVTTESRLQQTPLESVHHTAQGHGRHVPSAHHGPYEVIVPTT